MNLLIIQARMGSTRLPGKVLKQIDGQRTILESLIERMRVSKKIDAVLVATTINPEDDEIEQYCQSKSWNYYRGSDWDVLDRFYQGARSLECEPTNIIRVTSDCPLHSGEVVDFVIDEYDKAGTDYFSNSNHEPDFLEDGFDVEIFKFHALKTAWEDAKLLSQREHVTPYIKDSGKFTCNWKKSCEGYTYKLSVDTQEDFNTVFTIFEELKSLPNFTIQDVVTLLKKKPHILEHNKNSIINSGYQKSLANDKIIK
jgi:spore coat polysaccharide biosynthesis protein SpsF